MKVNEKHLLESHFPSAFRQLLMLNPDDHRNCVIAELDGLCVLLGLIC